MTYELNDCEHAFVPVPHQTGCARCGYARGHHPTVRQLREDARARRQEDRHARQMDKWARSYDALNGAPENDGDR